MSKTKAWLYAFRLRTLPLAFSSIITGSAIAYTQNRSEFNWAAFGLCLLTTLLLQILSNLANDYGDSEKGTDNEDRIGPKRAVQAGLLSFQEIKAGIIVCVLLCLIAGSALIYSAFGNVHLGYSAFFFVLGLAAIAAAIKYTVGKSAYGYQGLGDVFVLLFFGFVGVCGSYYLMAHKFDATVLLPAFTIGAFASGVLNLNNMRDMESDAKAGKNTLVVKLGLQRAKVYQYILIVSGFVSSFLFVFINAVSSVQFLFIITLVLFRKHLMKVKAIQELKDFDPLLKELALSTFIFSILFAVGLVVGKYA
ncbi:MAG: 1,4-dihydroxy-2-naphthoate polyprenyltransferase [Chitinophagales bacterium]